MRGVTFLYICCAFQLTAGNIIELLENDIKELDLYKLSENTSDEIKFNGNGEKIKEIIHTTKYKGTENRKHKLGTIMQIVIDVDELGNEIIYEKEITLSNSTLAASNSYKAAVGDFASLEGETNKQIPKNNTKPRQYSFDSSSRTSKAALSPENRLNNVETLNDNQFGQGIVSKQSLSSGSSNTIRPNHLRPQYGSDLSSKSSPAGTTIAPRPDNIYKLDSSNIAFGPGTTNIPKSSLEFASSSETYLPHGLTSPQTNRTVSSIMIEVDKDGKEVIYEKEITLSNSPSLVLNSSNAAAAAPASSSSQRSSIKIDEVGTNRKADKNRQKQNLQTDGTVTTIILEADENGNEVIHEKTITLSTLSVSNSSTSAASASLGLLNQDSSIIFGRFPGGTNRQTSEKNTARQNVVAQSGFDSKIIGPAIVSRQPTLKASTWPRKPGVFRPQIQYGLDSSSLSSAVASTKLQHNSRRGNAHRLVGNNLGVKQDGTNRPISSRYTSSGGQHSPKPGSNGLQNNGLSSSSCSPSAIVSDSFNQEYKPSRTSSLDGYGLFAAGKKNGRPNIGSENVKGVRAGLLSRRNRKDCRLTRLRLVVKMGVRRKQCTTC